jgi:hypothetical protein
VADDRLLRVVGAGAHDENRVTPRADFRADGNRSLTFVVIERGRLRSGRHCDDPSCAGGKDALRVAFERLLVDAAIFVERRHNRDEQALGTERSHAGSLRALGAYVLGMPPDETTPPSLDGRRFRALANSPGGQVTDETEFFFAQEGRLVHARYSGGTVALGFLVGVADADTIEFRYVHLDGEGAINSGHSVDTIEVLPDGRLRLHERWEWESKDGRGTSILEEVRGE